MYEHKMGVTTEEIEKQPEPRTAVDTAAGGDRDARGSISDIDKTSLTNEVKINIDDDVTVTDRIGKDSDALDNTHKNSLSGPSTTVVEIPVADVPCEDFSQDKDVPQLSGRVYDFNMVKQKTLPRININLARNGVVTMCGADRKTYTLTWILMLTSVLVCTLVLVWYFVN